MDFLLVGSRGVHRRCCETRETQVSSIVLKNSKIAGFENLANVAHWRFLPLQGAVRARGEEQSPWISTRHFGHGLLAAPAAPSLGLPFWTDLLNEFYKSYNVTSLLAGNTNCQMGGWFRKEVKTTADLAGLKFRIAGIAGNILQKVGVVPQQLAGGDVYPALEKGTIDAAEWVGPYDDEKLGLQKVAKFYYYPGFWEAGPMLHVMTNLEKWNSLPKYYQAVLANAAAHANIWMSARYDLVNPAALKRLVATGTQLRPFSNEILEACLKATNELWTEISTKNADFKKSIEAMQAYRNDQYLWWQVAEFTNDNFMIRSRPKS
jgi:TRAP-type mannitol/chloroaromatic compound transport system substrate-binding protein